jgi:predicted PurR-regulated permease PerM
MQPEGSSHEAIPRPLRIAAGLSWRLMVIAAAVVVLAIVISRLRLVFLPLVAALLLATVLTPAAAALRRRGCPAALAALGVLAGALAALAALVWAVAVPVAAELDELDVGVRAGIERVADWLSNGPLGLSEAQIDGAIERGFEELRSHSGTIAGGLISGTVLAVEVLAGTALASVLLFFFLKDGERIWGWLLGLFPEGQRADVDEIGKRAWRTLGAYLRGVAAVGLVDALVIGLALYLIGVPLVLPLAVLTFLGGFFPIVGATVAGFAAAMVALVSNGFTAALLVSAAVILVQQLEGNLLQPVIVGRSVRLHPVAVLLSLTAGAIVWGLAGAFLAVPLAAIVTEAALHLSSRGRAASAAEPPGPAGADGLVPQPAHRGAAASGSERGRPSSRRF